MEDLALWGPQACNPPPILSLVDAEQYCRRLACSHYENFPVVTWFLPRSLRQHFYNVYAYCRWADDLGDETGEPATSLMLLNWWRTELDRCYAGTATHPVLLALQTTIDRFSIPREHFMDLISAFEQDQTVQEYDSLPQLLDYCTRSANPVGRIILYLGECHDAQHAALSDSICTGLQLANFWQDVARDFEIGRIYLPREIRRQFGYSDAEMQTRRTTPEFQNMLQHLTGIARELLQQGQPLVGKMPGRLSMDIALFIRGGLLILDAIERVDYRVWEVRPKVKKSQLALAAMKAWCRWP